MPDKAEYIRDVADALGLRSDRDINALDSYVDDAVMDILTQEFGRFVELKRTQSISVLVDVRSYGVNIDFNSPFALYTLDDDGIINGEYSIVDAGEFVRRRVEQLDLTKYAYMDNETTGDDFQLIFALKPGATRTMRFDYFRFPTPQDVALIRNERIVTKYLRAQFPSTVNPNTDKDFLAYRDLRTTFANRAIPLGPHKIFRLSNKKRDHNTHMDLISREY